MKILVIGAGVTGSLYAARLFESGQDVTLLARGVRLDEVRSQGIILEDAETGERSVSWVPVTGQLEADQAFDLVLVLVRKNQVESLLPMLAENRSTPNVLFMVNNPTGPYEMIRALGRERVLIGFPGAGGIRENGVVRFAMTRRRIQTTMVGEFTGQISERLVEIAGVFERAGFPVTMSRQVDAWLKTHAALVSPIANAIYLAGGSTARLSRTRDGLVLLVRAMREGLHVLRAMGVPVTPWKFSFLLSLPEPVLIWGLSRGLNTARAQLVMAGHANAARDEMRQIYEEFIQLARTTSVRTPAIEVLGGFVDPRHEGLPEGNARLAVRWEEAVLAAGGVLAVWVILRKITRR